MIDLFCIFTTGGLILWSKSFVSFDFSEILNDLIKTILMDEKKTQDYYIPVKGNGIIIRWKIFNESGIIFVVVYQQNFNILYTDKLLDIVMKDFIKNQLPSLNHQKNIFYNLPEQKAYTTTFFSLLDKWEKFTKNEIKNKSLNNYVPKSKSENLSTDNTPSSKSTLLASSSTTQTPMPGMVGQNFVLRRKKQDYKNSSSKNKDTKKIKIKIIKKKEYGMMN